MRGCVQIRRIAVYLFFDPLGHVDDYVIYALDKLGEHVDHIQVVSNSPVDAAGLRKLQVVADDVWVRENQGFDVGAYRDALMRIGSEQLAAYDELVLLNYTFFAPISPFANLFKRMDAMDVDFWGITEHAEVVPNPITGVGTMPRHIQSHWIAVRRRMFESQAWSEYWSEMPDITSYNDSILYHESRFTSYFSEVGFSYAVAYPLENYPSDHPVFDNAALLLRDGCPILKRRIFFHDPLYLDRYAIIGQDILDEVQQTDYPTELIWHNVTRTSKPRVLATNFSLYDVISADSISHNEWAEEPGISIAVVVHVFHLDIFEEILHYALNIPGKFDLYVTTDTMKKAEVLRARLADFQRGTWEVRVVASNRGRDISAFLVACRDVLQPGRYDVIVKLHSKKSPQDDFNAANLFKRSLFENLLCTPQYAANIFHRFASEPSLGMVIPPMVHMGYPTIGHAWFSNKEPAEALAKELSITVPFDTSTPVAAYGSMFIARPEAIAPLTRASFGWDDFPEEGAYRDGTLSHVIERLFAYAALSEEFQVRTVMNQRFAALYYGFLEYKLIRLSERLPGYPIDQAAVLSQGHSAVSVLAALKYSVAVRSPKLRAALSPAYHSARELYRAVRARKFTWN